MPDPDRNYNNNYNGYNGSAAYEVRATAVPRPRPARLPEEKPLPQASQAEKPRLTIAPAAVAGLFLAMGLLVLVVCSIIRLYGVKTRTGELTKELAAANAATEKLRSTYESRIDLAEIEVRAKELGMMQPSTRQTVYLTIAGADHAEVLQVDRRGFAEKAWDGIVDGFNGILEYFR